MLSAGIARWAIPASDSRGRPEKREADLRPLSLAIGAALLLRDTSKHRKCAEAILEDLEIIRFNHRYRINERRRAATILIATPTKILLAQRTYQAHSNDAPITNAGTGYILDAASQTFQIDM
jgi:hypothetical protein